MRVTTDSSSLRSRLQRASFRIQSDTSVAVRPFWQLHAGAPELEEYVRTLNLFRFLHQNVLQHYCVYHSSTVVPPMVCRYTANHWPGMRTAAFSVVGVNARVRMKEPSVFSSSRPNVRAAGEKCGPHCFRARIIMIVQHPLLSSSLPTEQR